MEMGEGNRKRKEVLSKIELSKLGPWERRGIEIARGGLGEGKRDSRRERERRGGLNKT